MTARNWRAVRADADLNEDRVAEHQRRMLAEVRAARLADLRAEADFETGA